MLADVTLCVFSWSNNPDVRQLVSVPDQNRKKLFFEKVFVLGAWAPHDTQNYYATPDTTRVCQTTADHILKHGRCLMMSNL